MTQLPKINRVEAPLFAKGDTANFAAHSRNWRSFTLVYPVIARRSKGLSVGVNLNPDRICNFDCIYCEVNRRDFRPGKGPIPLPPRDILRPVVELDLLRDELTALLKLVKSGEIWQEKEFIATPAHLRRINDIAFSGDGEPTTFPQFAEAVQIAIDSRAAAGFRPDEVKLVLITNATQLHKPQVKAGLKLLDMANGEIWAKLDAGTPEYFRLVDKTAVHFERILANILATARQRPINIQTCMLRVHGMPPSPAEVVAYCERLRFIGANGGQLKMVQLYTVARIPAYDFATSLSEAELAEIADRIRTQTGLPVETFGGNIGL